MEEYDWVRWHDAYNNPGSPLHRRLLRVQHHVRSALDSRPAGPIRILSMCAGQGHDLIQPLAVHPRRDDVRALLVELEPRNAALAALAAREARLDVEVLAGDASITSAYAEIVPVDVALVCGVFGNIEDQYIHRTIEHLPGLLASGGAVIWTRDRREPDLTPTIRTWFARHGFDEVRFDTENGYLYSVGTHVLAGPTRRYQPDITLFGFDGRPPGRRVTP